MSNGNEKRNGCRERRAMLSLKVQTEKERMTKDDHQRRSLGAAVQIQSGAFHLRHGEVVEGCMRYFAGVGIRGGRGILGHCGPDHDLDLSNGRRTLPQCRELMREAGLDEKMIHAVAVMAMACAVRSSRNTRWKKCFLPWMSSPACWELPLACAPLKGFRSGAALGQEKFKDKKFAAGCSREVIQQGADRLGWTLDELIEKTILAMREDPKN